MRLSPTTEQQELKDAVRRFCREQITPERLARWQAEPSGIGASCWRAVAELGWLGLGLPAAAGGSGLGLVEVACLVEECARGLVPLCVSESVCAGLVLAALDSANTHLPQIVSGAQTVALAFDEQNRRDAAVCRTELTEGAGGLRVRGEKWYVSGGVQADLHIVAARQGQEVALVLVSGEAALASALRTFDGDRQAIVRYDDAPVLQRLSRPGQGAAMLVGVRRLLRALGLAEMIGCMDAALEMTVAYVKEREQFGQKIAVFQAVQHQVADMAMSLTAARHLAWQAITRLAAGSAEGWELDVAAAFVGQACKRVTLAAHHLHGGAGYVVEHPRHYHAERAQSLCIRHAPEASALAAIAADLLD